MEQEIGERERSSNLSIIGTQPSDASAYVCTAVNEPGTTAEQATLTVNGEIDSCTISMVCTLCGIPASLTSMHRYQSVSVSVRLSFFISMVKLKYR